MALRRSFLFLAVCCVLIGVCGGSASEHDVGVQSDEGNSALSASAAVSSSGHSTLGHVPENTGEVLAPGVPLIFEPEEDWKEILPGQQIPGGLEVRMDLSKGGKWARNLPGKTQRKGVDVAASSASVAIAAGSGDVLAVHEGGEAGVPGGSASKADGQAGSGAVDGMQGLDEAHKRMADILLGLPEPEVELTGVFSSGRAGQMGKEELQELLAKVWQKRQAQLKDAFSKAKTEAQQMQGLLARLVDPAGAGGAMSVEEQVEVMEGLEFYVTTVHNAEDFAAMGGLTAMALLTNSSDFRIASTAAWVLGTAVKGAPAVQAVALKDGTMPALYNLLRDSLAHAKNEYALAGTTPEGAEAVKHVEALGRSLKVVSKAVYALGGLLRYCPEGQQQFADTGGMALLAEAVESLTEVVLAWFAPEAGPDRTRVARQSYAANGKVLTLVADLFTHHEAQAGDGRVQQKVVKTGAEDGGSEGNESAAAAAVASVAEGEGEGGVRPGPAFTRLDKRGQATHVAGQGARNAADAVLDDFYSKYPELNPDTWPSAVRVLQYDRGNFQHLCGQCSRAHDTLTYARRMAMQRGVAFVSAEMADTAEEVSKEVMDACLRYLAGKPSQPGVVA